MPRRGPKAGDEGNAQSGRHIPVLLANVLEALKPRDGETYIDATFGAGGYTRAILEAANCKVIAFDRDPTAIASAAPMLAEFAGRLELIQAPFGDLLEMTQDVSASPTTVGSLSNTTLGSVGAQKECIDGVVFDLGVSSMQLDEAERGFSFQADGPLDMRMDSPGTHNATQERGEAKNPDASSPEATANQPEDDNTAAGRPPNTATNSTVAGSPPNTGTNSTVAGRPPNTGLPSVGAQEWPSTTSGNVGKKKQGLGPSAADVVNTYSETDLANIIYHLGDERRSRAIAKAIVARRSELPFTRTLDLANLIAKVLGRGPPGKNPATRTFQALRMYVNDELGQLVKGLAGAERALKPGGRLVVVTFHSLEDRVAKRFIATRSGKTEGVSRHMPTPSDSISPPSFQIINLRSLTSSKAELESNPRARSARLRSAVRTDADSWPVEAGDLGLPKLDIKN